MIGSSARATARYAGVAAGPAEDGFTQGASSGYLADPGQTFESTVRVAGTLPLHDTDPDPEGTVRYCFRTVDEGYALCAPMPATEILRPGAVLKLEGEVTGQRTQGQNCVTEIRADSITHLG